MGIFRDILNFLLPPRCINCGKIVEDENGLCPECFNQITFISEPYCSRCGLPFSDNSALNKKMLCPICIKDKKPIFRFMRSAMKYDDTCKKTILAFKFMDKTENAKVFARWLKLAGKDILETGADVLIPVPLHYKRLLKRKYNQSALLALELGKQTAISVDCMSLIKSKATKPQVSFSGQARVKNIKDSFKLKCTDNIIGKRVVLIDDVMTTGSTLRECAKVLLAGGASSVDALTVARVYQE